MTCVDPTYEAAMFAARRGIAFYCASEHYLHIADICGLGADARKVKAAWEERDFDRATGLVSDRLLEKFCLVGLPADNARRVQWLFDNGVYPIVYRCLVAIGWWKIITAFWNRSQTGHGSWTRL
jgi:hypothetical protein